MIKVGSICRCRKGITGIVQREVKIGTVVTFHGIAIDSGRVGLPWQSEQPVLVAKDLDEWVILRYQELKAKLI